ncbi:beta-ketoacyl synthase N-terminal-like domain-containing protein, partial [Nocardia lijiangensis]|uniref:beta-ketoacyl synthase N-terminal-like domain-containing protein n=1 Tax=Nocardia lijiangensis TaxID=299618 RepID=UPI0024807EEF
MENPGEFWRMLVESRGTAGLRHSLESIDAFDAEFFGMTAAEAVAADPQQRLVLELGWEVLEDGGIRPEDLHASRVGVFVGSMWDDYGELTKRQGIGGIGPETAAGVQRGMIANRLSHFLSVHGPSVTIDTGQSSSLAATHMAYRSIRSGETDIAIAVGINLAFETSNSDILAEWGALSPDGCCYTFDARANGFVRGEGGGAVLLKSLPRALADGDHIYCVISGSGMGHGSADRITTPSVQSQAKLLRETYEESGIDPASVQYLELHGPGTRVGDPIEAEAAGAVLGAVSNRTEELIVGSVKTNIGHLEGAAGIAGLIKAVLCMENRWIPATLNYSTPNPDIPLTDLRMRVQEEPSEWPNPARPLVAGVSSFGMGGSNCHIILSELPSGERLRLESDEPADHNVSADRSHELPVWVVSAKSAAALRDQADRLLDHMRNCPEFRPSKVGRALLESRALFDHRAVIVGRDREALLTGLERVAAGQAAGVLRGEAAGFGVAVGAVGGVGSGVGLVFSGQGSQRVGMGLGLCVFPPFAATLDRVCAVLDPLVG